MKKIISIIALFVCQGVALGQTIKDDKIANLFDVSIEKKNNAFNVIIKNSLNPATANLLSFPDTDSDSYITSQIIQLLENLYPEYEIYFPDTKIPFKLGITSSTPKNEVVDKLKAAFLKLGNQSQQLEIVKKKLMVGTFNDSKSLANNTSTTLYNNPSGNSILLKKDNGGQYSLVFGGSTAVINPTDNDSYLKAILDFLIANPTAIPLIFDDQIDVHYKSVRFNNSQNHAQLEKTILELRKGEKINNYNYLGYVGTNFDLVEGVKAKNVFFAVNIMQKPKLVRGRTGFYVSIYGNRTLSKIDSVKNNRYNYRVFDTVVNGQTQRYLQNKLYDYSKTVNIDNIGAYFSPLIKMNLFKLSNLNGETELFYAPSLEFIWRRISVTNAISNVRNDQPYLIPATVDPYTQSFSIETNNYRYNAYDFNAGLVGFFLIHENQKISVRLNMNIGIKSSFKPEYGIITRGSAFEDTNTFVKQSDWFYTGKLWITEASTGVTLQAEILNTLKQPNPFYGVTLSKAFDFEKIGSFFKPITKP